jgi:hypothetical protein
MKMMHLKFHGECNCRLNKDSVPAVLTTYIFRTIITKIWAKYNLNYKHLMSRDMDA